VTTIAAVPQNVWSLLTRLHTSATQRLAKPTWLSSKTGT